MRASEFEASDDSPTDASAAVTTGEPSGFGGEDGPETLRPVVHLRSRARNVTPLELSYEDLIRGAKPTSDPLDS
ncbi:hypothetical protein [Frondihabitans cladoniiphilus]|uniref:Uncharacterized protein n=1 Tax=Frondihabitans cladoniiphilus TaxID=715785 RepID=A0ABP8VJP2_9MICO